MAHKWRRLRFFAPIFIFAVFVALVLLVVFAKRIPGTYLLTGVGAGCVTVIVGCLWSIFGPAAQEKAKPPALALAPKPKADLKADLKPAPPLNPATDNAPPPKHDLSNNRNSKRTPAPDSNNTPAPDSNNNPAPVSVSDDTPASGMRRFGLFMSAVVASALFTGYTFRGEQEQERARHKFIEYVRGGVGTKVEATQQFTEMYIQDFWKPWIKNNELLEQRSKMLSETITPLNELDYKWLMRTLEYAYHIEKDKLLQFPQYQKLKREMDETQEVSWMNWRPFDVKDDKYHNPISDKNWNVEKEKKRILAEMETESINYSLNYRDFLQQPQSSFDSIGEAVKMANDDKAHEDNVKRMNASQQKEIEQKLKDAEEKAERRVEENNKAREENEKRNEIDKINQTFGAIGAHYESELDLEKDQRVMDALRFQKSDPNKEKKQLEKDVKVLKWFSSRQMETKSDLQVSTQIDWFLQFLMNGELPPDALAEYDENDIEEVPSSDNNNIYNSRVVLTHTSLLFMKYYQTLRMHLDIVRKGKNRIRGGGEYNDNLSDTDRKIQRAFKYIQTSISDFQNYNRAKKATILNCADYVMKYLLPKVFVDNDESRAVLKSFLIANYNEPLTKYVSATNRDGDGGDFDYVDQYYIAQKTVEYRADVYGLNGILLYWKVIDELPQIGHNLDFYYKLPLLDSTNPSANKQSYSDNLQLIIGGAVGGAVGTLGLVELIGRSLLL